MILSEIQSETVNIVCNLYTPIDCVQAYRRCSLALLSGSVAMSSPPPSHTNQITDANQNTNQNGDNEIKIGTVQVNRERDGVKFDFELDLFPI